MNQSTSLRLVHTAPGLAPYYAPIIWSGFAPIATTNTSKSTKYCGKCIAKWSMKRPVKSPGSAAKSNETQIPTRSEEHTSELQSLMRISYAVFCLKKKKTQKKTNKQVKTHKNK